MTESDRFPSREELLRFIRESETPVGRREIVRAFGLKGADRARLGSEIKALKDEGLLEGGRRRRVAAPGRLPEICVIQVTGLDEDGELLARPVRWEAEGLPPRILMVPDRGSRAALAVGDRVLARLKLVEEGLYEARTVRRLAAGPRRILGIYELGPQGGRLRPTDRRAKEDYVLRKGDTKGAEPGELLLTELKPHHARLGPREVTVVERLGGLENQRALSLISIHEHGLPTVFSEAALAEAERSGPTPIEKREDLRALPLVTIDGADARDFDDAVFAEADEDPGNPGGWHLLVAIADVAHYVTPGSALDRAALERGNSAYFPDRVVPMLPEALSNGWCSLKPGEDRGCLFVHLWIDREGKALRQRFGRGLMRSAARLTYEEVQAAFDGAPSEPLAPLMELVIRPLYGAFRALLAERRRRGTLDLDIPERRVVMDESGNVARIEPRSRLDSHRLVEEFMIAANVAAASELERLKQPCMYRIHDEPDKAKVEALAEVLDSLGLRLARGQVIRPQSFTNVLEKVAGTPHAAMVGELVLRAQAQAVYSPVNIGHFGLALTRYAHFTSPIRRYSDLLVHRALIAGLRLGRGLLKPEEASRLPELGEHLSMTERRAAAAEREAVDRLTAAFLAGQTGAVFAGRVSGVTRFGLFVTLEESGADGLVPVSTLGEDYFVHDERAHALVGRRSGRRYLLGQKISALLVEADPLTGGLLLKLLEQNVEEDAGSRSSAAPGRGKGKKRGRAASRPSDGKVRARRGGKPRGRAS